MRILAYIKLTPIFFNRPGSEEEKRLKQQYELKLANLADKLQKQLEDILNERLRRDKDGVETYNITDWD